MAADHPEELRKRLALLGSKSPAVPFAHCVSEGDKKAYYESSQETMKANKDVINQLRKENKAMTAKLKQLKVLTS